MSIVFEQSVDREQIEKFIRLCFEPGVLIELRRIRPQGGGRIGYFNDHEALIENAAELSNSSHIYVALNPPPPAFYHRSADHIGTYEGVKNEEIETRRLLLIDCDSEIRPKDKPATDEEWNAALDRTREVRDYLTMQGWPEPLFASSGNGGHLVYRIDLPGADGGLVESILYRLAERFNDRLVKVDTAVHNAARISRVYGTMNIKGENTPERPHRLAQILEAPSRLEVVSRELLIAVGGTPREVREAGPSIAGMLGKPFDIPAFLDKCGVEYELRGGKYQLRKCPFDNHKEDFKAAVWLIEDKPQFHCFKAGCCDKKWLDFCEAVKPPEAAKPPRKANIVTRVVELALERDEFFHTPDGAAFVVYEHNNVKFADILSERYALLLRTRYSDKYGDSVQPAKLNQALLDLEGHALFKRPEFPISLRCASADGSIYIDTGNQRQDVVRVFDKGWTIGNVPESVRFRRSEQMRAFPNPELGDISLLRPFVNVTDDDWPLVVGWLLAALNPSIECPILSLVGEAGSAKSTTANILQRFVDPQAGDELPGFPRKEQDVMVAAHNSWLLAFDNLSKLTQEQSDVLCRIVTGGSFQTRKLYSDSSLVTLRARRPMVITSVEDVIAASDLADRAIVLPLLKPTTPRLKIELFAELDAIRGRVFGALLDGMVAGMSGFAAAKVERTPRMAEFARFVTAAETAMGFESGQTMAAYWRTQQRTALSLVDDSPLATAILDRLGSAPLEGFAKAIRHELGEGEWPRNAKPFGDALTSIAPSLRGAGVRVVCRQKDGRNYWEFSQN